MHTGALTVNAVARCLGGGRGGGEGEVVLLQILLHLYSWHGTVVQAIQKVTACCGSKSETQPLNTLTITLVYRRKVELS